MTTCTQVAVGSLFVLTLTACGGGGGSSEPAQAAADPDPTIEWQGDWQVDTSYALNDIVYFQGQAFINVLPTMGSEGPQDTSHWELLVDRGETGPIGPQGIAGTEGAVGPTGLTGPQGVAGADGATGPAGPASLVWQGAYTGGNSYQINDAVSFNGSAYISIQDTTGSEDPSDTSYWELLAEKGADGSAGPQGPIGATGNDGVAGPIGVAGADGVIGPTGSAGPQGIAGADGAVGPTGSTGPQGIAGADGATGSTGPAGPQGTAGATGPAGPSSLVWQGAYTGGNSYQINDAVSFNGSAYISILNTTGTEDPNDTIYWEMLAEKGADGSAGPQGPIGATGNDGVAGPIGVAGADGAVGSTGPQGIAGTDGTSGPTGTTGPQGVAGADGASGPTGPTGPQGMAGADGATGPAGPASLVWQGAYTGGNNYQINDAVSFNGSAYISIQDTTGSEDPSDTSYWELLAEKGADGSTGPQGPIGATGNDGADGENGQNGAAGSPGPQGPQGGTGPQGSVGAAGPAGADGDNGQDGAAGAVGPQGLQGEKGLDWQGVWQSGVVYLIDDAVFYQGSAYIAIQESTGSEKPGETAFWDLLSASANPNYLAVGFSSTQVAGNSGYLGINGACKADYGSSARIATTVELMKSSASFPTGTGDAWIQNHIDSRYGWGGDMDKITTYNGSRANCEGWSVGTNSQTVDLSTLHFGYDSCSAVNPVVCAIPQADSVQVNQFVGFSSSTVLGSGGLRAMNTACQLDFGSEARLATETEVFESSDVVPQNGIAWIQTLGDKRRIIHYYIPSDTSQYVTCQGWSYSGNGGQKGLVVDGNLSANVNACNASAYVACSTP